MNRFDCSYLIFDLLQVTIPYKLCETERLKMFGRHPFEAKHHELRASESPRPLCSAEYDYESVILF